MVRHYLVLSTIFIFVSLNVFSQNGFVTTIGGAARDEGRSIIQMGDGGFAILGTSNSTGGAGNNDIYLIRTSAAGAVMYTKTYGNTGIDEGISITRALDGGFILLCKGKSFSSSYFSTYLIKTDSLGNMLWSKVWGNNTDHTPMNVLATSDGGYIITMWSGVAQPAVHGFLIKTDGNGNIVWQKTQVGDDLDQYFGITETSDGGYIVVGGSVSYASIGFQDMIYLKLDSNGNIVWRKVYGSVDFDTILQVIEANDGGFVMTGYSWPGGIIRKTFIFKTDATGTVQWNKKYDSPNHVVPYSIKKTSNGYIIFVNTFVSAISTYDIGYIRIDTLGNLLQSRKFGGTNGEALGLNGNPGVVCADGTFAGVGYTQSYNYGNNANVFFYKTTATGSTPTDCASSAFPITVINQTYSYGGTFNIQTGNVAPINHTLNTNTITTVCQTNPCLTNNPFDVFLGADIDTCSASITLNAGNPGATYLWNDGSTGQTLTVSASGTYYVTIQSACGTARDTINVNLTPGNAISVNLGADTTICQGTNVVLNAGNSGSSFLWNNGSNAQTLTVNNPGTYYVTVSNACNIGRDTIVITANNAPPINVNLGSDISTCATNAPITLNAGNPGATYVWNNNSTAQTLQVSTTGTYFVTASNACFTDRDTIQVAFVSPPVINVALGNDTSVCAGTTVTVNAGNPGSSYLWNGGQTSQVIDISIPGTYIVTVSNACYTDVDTIVVSNLNVPPINVTLGNDISTCITNAPIILNAGNPGATYVWNNNSTAQTLQVSTTGTYFVTASNACFTDRDTIQVAFVSPPVINVALGNDTTVCPGSPVVLNAGNPGSTYLWNGGQTTQTLNVSAAGTYIVTATNACYTDRDTIVIANYNVSPPNVNLGNNVSQCTIQWPVTLDAGNAGNNYIWNTGQQSQTIQISAPGTFIIEVFNACYSDVDTVIYSILPDQPVAVSLPANFDTCATGPIQLTSSTTGNGSLLWNANNQTTPSINITQSGTYIVTYTNLCYSDADTIVVGVHSATPFSIIGDTIICPSVVVTLQPDVTGAQYLWSDGSTAPNLTTNIPGAYWLQLTNQFGCFSYDTVTTVDGIYPIAALSNDTSVCAAELTIQALLYVGDILWNTGDTAQSITINQSGWYWLTSSSECGSVTDSIYVTIIPSLDAIGIIPDVFTPNSDGINEAFGFGEFGFTSLQGNMTIYNRWGHKVFETTDLLSGWNGENHSDGVYYYILNYKDCNNSNTEKRGAITLMRN